MAEDDGVSIIGHRYTSSSEQRRAENQRLMAKIVESSTRPRMQPHQNLQLSIATMTPHENDSQPNDKPLLIAEHVD